MLVGCFVIPWWWLVKRALFKTVFSWSFLRCWWSLLARSLIVVLRTPLERDYIGSKEKVLNFFLSLLALLEF